MQQDFPNIPSVVPPPPEFGLRNQTPILAPPPEFSDARDTHESATRFNQGHNQGDQNVLAGASHQQQKPFNRQSPMYRSISHAHSSNSSLYSGYPTMTRQQYNQQYHHQMMQQHQQLQCQQAQQQQQQQHHAMPPQAQSQQQYISSSMPLYQTLGRHQTYSTSGNQGVVNTANYGHYGTLQPQKASQQPSPGQSSGVFQGHHHPKCYYYQQTPSGPAGSSGSSTSNPGGKYIPEKLHPVHRYTPGKLGNQVSVKL